MLKVTVPIALALAVSNLSGATLPAHEDTSSLKGKLSLAANKGATLAVDGSRRAFVYFNLAEVPAGASLRYARLRIYFPTVARAGAGLTLHQITGAWSEGAASTEPTYGSSLGSFPASEIGAKRFISIDVTATVNGWLANPASNEGFAVAAVPGSTSRDTASLTIGAKEGSGSGYPAELEMEFVSPLLPGSVGGSAIAPGAVGNTQLAPNLALSGVTTGTFAGSGAGLHSLPSSALTGALTVAPAGFSQKVGSFLRQGNGAPAVAVIGSIAYVAHSSQGADILEVSDPANPIALGKINGTQGTGGIAISGSRAYFAMYGGLTTFDVSDPAAPVEISTTSSGLGGGSTTAKDIIVSGQRVYAAYTFGGVAIFDVSNPSSPQVLGTLPTLQAADGVAVAGDILYVANGNDGVRSYNVANPAAPQPVAHLATPSEAVAIKIAGDRLFLGHRSGVRVYNIQNPANPTLLAFRTETGDLQDIFLSGSYLYLAHVDLGLGIYDVSNPASLIPKGWLKHGSAIGLTVRGNYAYVSHLNGLHIYSIASAVAAGFHGDGSGLTNVKASALNGQLTGSQIANGAIGNAQLASNLTLTGTTTGTFAGDGSGLTNLNVSALRAADFMNWVEVAEAGNTTDFSQGFGHVDTAYRIGKHEVTNAQYAKFLNAVAAADPNNLYAAAMGTETRGGIVRIGVAGSYRYACRRAMADKPVNFVSWYSAIRFANWMHHGMPTGPQGAGTTEDGAYPITGSAPNWTVGARSAAAKVWLPSENEWYKAAYFDPAKNGGVPGYWLYPTQCDASVPPHECPANTAGDLFNPPSLRVANFNRGASWNEVIGNVATVGSGGPASESFYGAADMAGNVAEWNETVGAGDARCIRGGGWNGAQESLRGESRAWLTAGEIDVAVGFRVAGK